jgi:hypothetical protein
MPLVVDLDLAWLRVAIRDLRCCSDPIALLVHMATPAGEYNWRASLIAVVRVLPDIIVDGGMAVFDQSLPKSGAFIDFAAFADCGRHIVASTLN